MAATPSTGPKKPIPGYIKFLFGGSAGMAATLFVQPLDLVKNRMQLSGEGGQARMYKNSLHALRTIMKSEGMLSVYTGLSAGLLRQATYTTTRLGVYSILFDKVQGDSKAPPSFLTKMGIGMTAGAIGSFVGTPAEISLIRMTADGRLPKEQQRAYKNVFNALSRIVSEEGVLTLWRGCGPTVARAMVYMAYKNVFNALSRIVSEEGVLTLWRGCGPTVARAMVVNAAQLSTYSQAKQFILSTGYVKDGIPCHFVASMISGFVTTIASMPVDIAKTRVQNMRVIDGKPEYTGAIDVIRRTVSKEGFFSLWKGFTPYFARLGPHTVLTFIFLEQANKAYKKYVMKDESVSGGL